MKAAYIEAPQLAPWLDRFPDDVPELQWRALRRETLARDSLDGMEILVLMHRECTPALREALDHAGSVRWMHFVTSGYDQALKMGMPEGVQASSATSVKASNIAEHTLTILMALRRQLPELGRHQRAHQWRREEMRSRVAALESSVVCVVGMGAIGREAARKATALGARVIGVSREGTPDDDFLEVYPRSRIREAFAAADSVLVCTAADESSHHLIGADEIAAMKKSANIVNIARGSLIDEPELIAALRENRIAGAGLDVMETEPLPPESPLWDLPNVILSPHIANFGADQYRPHVTLFKENLARYKGKKPLLNPCRL